ncbi:class IV adenylate cyclase [Halopenitus persicus]|uniref:Adenylate cyclase, class 2 n=1 Tax=Halopenitus persicus TaxID=1048396 RepID=A0A1H3H3Y5_9EURY|nr:class IV adenylate cyclase [Halopenitus persicus]QHS16120.1 class IV adenylate cyclase [haloarchaeon 3A1-DGR]SDY10050.1 adenylate cyclase, class 2 [Halopenitus persicus]
MYEVELKVAADVAAVRDRLASTDADRLEAIRQVDTYYDAPDRDFAATDEALRVRVEHPIADVGGEDGDGTDAENGDGTDEYGDGTDIENGDGNGTEIDDVPTSRTKVTYKGPLLEEASKTREEHETVVADGEEMAAILDGLGYTPAATVEKRREFYRIDGYTLTLDRVDDVGEFVEIERDVETVDGIEAARDRARELLRELGLDPDDQIRTSYLGLLLAADV